MTVNVKVFAKQSQQIPNYQVVIFLDNFILAAHEKNGQKYKPVE